MSEISIIVPVYNVEKYIHRCVESILAQTFDDFELILVDDGSEDHSGDICDDYALSDRRIKVFHQENKGQATARNFALDWVYQNSDSSWLCFIDSDDWVNPVYLEALLNAARDLGTQIASCNFIKTSQMIQPEPVSATPRLVSAFEDYTRGDEKIYAYPFMRLFSTDLWRDIRFPDGKFWEDLAIMYKIIFSVENIAWIDADLYYYFFNPNGTVNRTWTPRRLDEFDAYEEQLTYFSGNPGWSGLYKTIQKVYIRAIGYSYYMEQHSDLPEDQKEYYGKTISIKMRRTLRKYRRSAGIHFKEDKEVFEAAYPRLMKWYWYFCALRSKLLKGRDKMSRIIDSLNARIQKEQSHKFEMTKYGRSLAKLKDSRKGEKCIIVGNGPSLLADDLEVVYKKGIETFATNRIFKIFDQTDWRPTYYVSEDILLMEDAQDIIRDMDVEKRFIPINLKWFQGVDIPNADYFYIEYNKEITETFNLSIDIPHCIRCRGTVTVTCLQLAIYMGFSEIYLIGVDHSFAKMFDRNGNVVIDDSIKNHFTDDYDQGIIDQGFNVDNATAAYMDVERLSRKMGTFRVFNATRGGKLEVFERVDLDDVLRTE